MSPIGSFLEKKIKSRFGSLASSWIKAGKAPPLDLNLGPSLLALRPDRLGDFILSVPALRKLEGALGPGGRLTLVAGERNAGLARYLFPKARVLVFRKSFFSRLPLWVKLAFGRFDAVVDFHSFPFSTTSALAALLSSRSRRIGFWDQGGSAELSREIFDWGMAAPDEALPEKEKSLLLAGRLVSRRGKAEPLIRLPDLPEETKRKAGVFFGGMKLRPGDRVVGIHPTLLKKDNRWPPDRYVDLAWSLSKMAPVKLAVVYGQGEEEELRMFLGKLGPSTPVFPLPGNELLFILECLSRMDLFIGGDSGLTHLAALVTPVVAVFGPSDPRRWGPMVNGMGAPKILRGKDGSCDSVGASEVLREVKKKLKIK